MPEHGAFGYTVESNLDLSRRLADTSLTFDSRGRWKRRSKRPWRGRPASSP